MFLAKHSIPVLINPTYSTDVAPCYFIVCPKFNSKLKETIFGSMESVKASVPEIHNKLTEEDFKHFFAHWKIRMERCRYNIGEYMEGDKISYVTGGE